MNLQREEAMAAGVSEGQDSSANRTKAGNTFNSHRLIRNGLYSNGTWVASVVSALVITPFLVRRLGLEGYGVYALLTSWVGYTALLDFGLGQGLIRFIAQHHAQGDRSEVYAGVNAVLGVHLLIGVVGAGTLSICAPALLDIFQVPDALLSSARGALYASAVGFLFTMAHASLSSALSGLQRYDLTSGVNIISSLGSAAGTLVVILLGFGLREVVMISAAGSILAATACALMLRTSLPGWPAGGTGHLKGLLSFSGYLFISQISSFAGQHGARFVVASFIGPAAVTLYAIPMKIINLLGGFLGSAFGVLFPYVSELQGKQYHAELRRLYTDASRGFAALALPVILAMIPCSRAILRVWMGEEFAAQTWPYFSLLAAICGIGSLTTIPAMIILGLGHSRSRSLFSLFSFLATVVLLLVLTPRYGLIGTVNSLWASALTGQALIIYATRRIIGVSVWPYYRMVLGVHALPALIALALVVPFSSQDRLQEPWSIVFLVSWLGVYVVILSSKGILPVKRLMGHLRVGSTVVSSGTAGVNDVAL